MDIHQAESQLNLVTDQHGWQESPAEDDFTDEPLSPNRSTPPVSPPREARPGFQDRNKIFSDRLGKSFAPLEVFLISVGRFPFVSLRQKDSTRLYEWDWTDLNSLWFWFVTLAFFYILICGFWSVFAILLDGDSRDDNATSEVKVNETFIYEKVLVQRHLVVIVVICTSLVHCLVTSLTIIGKADYMGRYLSFWTKAVQIMHMDVAKGALKKTLVVIIFYLCVLTSLVVLSVLQVGPASTSAPTLIGILMFRQFSQPLYRVNSTLIPDDQSTLNAPRFHHEIIDQYPETRMVVKIAGGLFFAVIYASSKAYVFAFIFFCEMLTSGFAHWNGRLYAAIHKSGRDTFRSLKGRTTFKRLFEDHCILVDLMEGTDRFFSIILESYYGLTVLSLCFELYFFLRTVQHGSNRDEGAANGGQFFIRPNDWAPALIIFTLSLFVFIMVTLVATEVGEEASAGLDVLRRMSLLGRKTDEELFFVLTMNNSFTSSKKLEMTGGGYFYINKEFLLGFFSLMFSYFIVLYQFQPSLDHRNEGNLTQREIIGQFLTKIEGLRPDDHYLATREPPTGITSSTTEDSIY